MEMNEIFIPRKKNTHTSQDRGTENKNEIKPYKIKSSDKKNIRRLIFFNTLYNKTPVNRQGTINGNQRTLSHNNKNC